jgi:hypothetical protein
MTTRLIPRKRGARFCCAGWRKPWRRKVFRRTPWQPTGQCRRHRGRRPHRRAAAWLASIQSRPGSAFGSEQHRRCCKPDTRRQRRIGTGPRRIGRQRVAPEHDPGGVQIDPAVRRAAREHRRDPCHPGNHNRGCSATAAHRNPPTQVSAPRRNRKHRPRSGGCASKTAPRRQTAAFVP